MQTVFQLDTEIINDPCRHNSKIGRAFLYSIHRENASLPRLVIIHLSIYCLYDIAILRVQFVTYKPLKRLRVKP